MGFIANDISSDVDMAADAIERFKAHRDIEQCMREVSIAVDGIYIDKKAFLNQISKLLLASNPDRAIKLVRVLGPHDIRPWFSTTVILVVHAFRLGWKVAIVAAVVVGTVMVMQRMGAI